MVEELLAARSVDLTYDTVRRWSVKFGLGIARRIRSTALARGDKWRAVDQHGAVLNILVQSRRDRHAARRLLRKLLKEARTRTARSDHRQAQKLRRGEQRPGAERRAPPA